MLRNLASALFLTERPDADLYPNAPKVKGRIVTTLAKAKEVRPLVEKCVTLARRGRLAEQAAAEFSTDAERNTEAWKQWRGGSDYPKWVQATAPAVLARRRLHQMLGDKEAVAILMDEIAERFEDRPGGYTRIMRLATPRLGDAGPRAILEFVGKNDRVDQRSQKPEFGSSELAATGTAAATESATDDESAEDQDQPTPDATAEAQTTDESGREDTENKSDKSE